MMRPRIARATLALAAALTLAACGDGTGPTTLAGTYVLRSVDGEPLPVLRFTMFEVHPTGGAATTRYNLLAMRLVVRAAMPDTLYESYRVDWDLQEGADPAPETRTIVRPVVVRGDTLCGWSPSPYPFGGAMNEDDARCAGAPRLTRWRDGFVIDMPVAASTTPVDYVFEKQ